MKHIWQRRWMIGMSFVLAIGASSCVLVQPLLHQASSFRGSTFTDASVEITVAGFNVESGDANPMVIADQHIAPVEGIDIWGFSEVQNAEWLRILEEGTEAGEGADFRAILGQSGGGDRLATVYNPDLLRELSTDELDALSFGGRVRAALITHFQVLANGQEFLFVVNHLYRSKDDLRHEQAQMLNAWAQTQTLPIIAVGDYNFDFDVIQGDGGTRDRGFDLMIQNGIFEWIRPQVLVASHCNSEYNTILDFIFVGNQAMDWTVTESTILFSDPQSGYCPDDALKSDHHPVTATFNIPPP
jgi:endonuclease/exonuclease/phosphatase family metal-dependent hydrolase